MSDGLRVVRASGIGLALCLVACSSSVVGPTAGDYKVTWQKLAATGAALSDPVVVPGSKKYAAVGGVAFDSDTVALLSDGMSLDAVRLGPSGAIVTAPFTVATRPYAMRSHNTDQLFARRGTE